MPFINFQSIHTCPLAYNLILHKIFYSFHQYYITCKIHCIKCREFEVAGIFTASLFYLKLA